MSKSSKKIYPTEHQQESVVNEPAMYYNSPAFGSNIMNISSPYSNNSINKMTSFEKMALLDLGLRKSHLETFKSKARLDYDRLAQALSVTRATLINKKDNEPYSENVSEKIIALTDLYSYGYEVFESEEKFNSWMFRPNASLGGKMPFDIVDNQFGREEIKNIIGRIEYGVFS